MALQTSIAEYFNLKKRGASALDESKNNINTVPSKVLILHDNLVNVEARPKGKDVEIAPPSRAIIYVNESPAATKISSSSRSLSLKRSKKRSTQKACEKTSTGQTDIRKCLWPEKLAQEKEPEPQKPLIPQEPVAENVNVPFRIHHLSPKKKILTPTKANPNQTPRASELSNREEAVAEEISGKGSSQPENILEQSTPKKSALAVEIKEVQTPGSSSDPVTPKKETNEWGEDKSRIESSKPVESVCDRLKKSEKLVNLQERLKKFHSGLGKLKEIQERKKDLAASPKIKEFDTLEFEIIATPKKSIDTEAPKVPNSPSLLRRALFLSPKKQQPGTSTYKSPRKLFDNPPQTSPMKPAYQRYEDLASTGKPALPLPYKYRVLAETFRAVDAVASMMFNRKESIVFNKLQTSVQQLTNRKLTENHVGQILAVLPSAFEVKREKQRFARNPQEEYLLVLYPTFSSDGSANGNGENSGLMTPSILLQRRRNFYNALLLRVIERHQSFLRSLDPPLVIPKEKLMRWHPEFDVDATCSDIAAASLPSPPVNEKSASAKDVLGKAKDMFCSNNRMEKALEKLSGGQEPATKSEASAATAAFTKALKGIPKSLLEKVRAKQAAKTAAFLTRSPAEVKRCSELTRLPELARILRMIFVLERKNVMPLPDVVDKVIRSYREELSQDDLIRHIQHIITSAPGWIVEHSDGNKKYLRLSRDADLAQVIARLKRQIDENQVNP